MTRPSAGELTVAVACGVAAISILRFARRNPRRGDANATPHQQEPAPRRKASLARHQASLTVTPGKARTNFYSKNFADVVRERVVIAMVGLPARGKSYMSKAIIRYFNFLGVSCKVAIMQR